MILLPCQDRCAAKALLKDANEFLEEQGDPADIMFNKALEAAADDAFTLHELPEE